MMNQSTNRQANFFKTPAAWGVFLLLLLAGGVAGYLLGLAQSPGENSADVGFARDMSDHHAQAVLMSALAYDRTEDELIRTLAYDILTTQQGQIGIMGGWLDVWGHGWNGSGPRMEWMGMSVEVRMPGMATSEEINQLREASGVEADILFMELMIPHHESGVMMAEAAVSRARTDVVRSLAQSMADSQRAEIEYMQARLAEKGAASGSQ